MPRLTVIMAAKNSERTIHSALSTTLRALPLDAEIAVWDDGSTDRTAEIASAVAPSRIRVFRSEVNRGSGYARHALVDSTDSEYIANMDADDICFRHRFRLQLRDIAEADLTFGSALLMRNAFPKVRVSQPLPVKPEYAHAELLFGNPFPHSSMLARRSALEPVGSYRDLRRGQDYDLWLRLASNGARFHKRATPLFGYRRSVTQVSAAVDYTKKLQNDPELVDSYKALYSLHTGRDFAGAIYAQHGEHLDGIFRTLPPIKRAYYKRLINNGHFFAPA